MRAIVFLFLLFGASVLGCTSNADCGGVGQEGLCFAGVCQCGVGYSGNQAIDPSVCGLTCTPPPVPDSVAFLVEPNVTVTAASGNVVLDISLDPYLKQVPTTIAFNNPTNGTACSLMPQLLGQGTWSQAIDDSAGQCLSKYLLATPFAATVGGACWDAAASHVETGAQYSVTFNEYKTEVEVIQSGLAPFGQVAGKRDMFEGRIVRAFRRDFSIFVAVECKVNDAHFTQLASGLFYRLVSIGYDVSAKVMRANLQARTSSLALASKLVLKVGGSSDTLAMFIEPLRDASCDGSGDNVLCDLFFEFSFVGAPCQLGKSEPVVSLESQCTQGIDLTACGVFMLPLNFSNFWVESGSC